MRSYLFHHLAPTKILTFSSVVLGICVFVSYGLISTNFNLAWMLTIHAHPVLPEMLWALVNLGGDAAIALLILLLAERQPGVITSWVIKTWIGGALIAQAVKYFFPMPRPGAVIGIEHLSFIENPPVTSGSMPSGHALAAFSVGLILCALVSQHKKNGVWILFIALLSALAAWARVAVGAHWPSDVIAGAGLAFLIASFTLIWERHQSWNHWFQTKAGGVLLILIHLLIAAYLTMPQSTFSVVVLAQICLCLVSLVRAFMLIKLHFWGPLPNLEIKR